MSQTNNRLAAATQKLTEEANKLFKHLAVNFITTNVPEYDISSTYDAAKPDGDPIKLMETLKDRTVSFPSYVQPIFSSEDGEIVTFEERFYNEEKDEGNAQRSMSIRRAPNVKAFNNLRGSSSNVPFLPGGFEEEMEKLFRLSDREELKNEEEQKCLDTDSSDLLDVPPGFEHKVPLSRFALKAAAADDQPNGLSTTSAKPVDDGTEDILKALSLTDLQKSLSSKTVTTSTSIVKLESPLKKDTQQEPQSTTEISSDVMEKLQETIERNVAPSAENSTGRLVKRRILSDEDQFLYAKMIDLKKPAPRYAEMKSSLAKTFPFELDSFQQHAVVSMEEGTSVFIAAHTSAGKTVVAEYAIALCKINKTRVVYTSPIKALSNQKYRDFKMTFDDVGLVTGDIQLNTDAFCLIMTTEILRSMIYNGSEAIRELEWVIFDEVHYINDEERGYVWEEILIMLPSHVKIVMLSATVPNCMEFADWVGRIKNRKINVIQTSKRPVPLEHYIYTGKDGRTKNDRFLILNKEGEFLQGNYLKAVEAKKRGMAKHSGPDRRQYAHANDRNIYINLIDHLKNKDLLPMVVFVFSRKRCDQAASLLQSIDLTTAKEKSEVHKFFTKCVDRLKGTDRRLPQLLQMQEHCQRGFAVHHSGILPIIKEVVELLFQKGYVKILFATETFAMGVNMPARTVVFDTIEKFDGNSRRFLNVTEYVQMAGRAGRRGLDSTGTVIIISKGNELPELSCLKQMLIGKPIHLESRFRITYGMILNLLRVEQLRIEDMMQRSFVERNSLKLMSSRKEQLQQLAVQIRDLPIIECPKCVPSSSSLAMPELSSSALLPIDTPLLDTKEQASTVSIMDYFEGLRAYLAQRQALWLELVLKHGVDKYLNQGRIIIIDYPPLNLYGRLGVVLQGRRLEEGLFYMTVLIAADCDLVATVETKQKEYNSLVPEKRKWRVESNLLTHYGVKGLDAIDLPLGWERSTKSSFNRHSYYIIEQLGLDSLSAICKKNLKIQDSDVIMREFHGLRRLNRDVSPTGILQNLVNQLNKLAVSWASLPSPNYAVNSEEPANVKPIYLLGKDIMKSEINIHKAISEFRDLRTRLMDPQCYPCLQCPTFEKHFVKLLKRVSLEEQRKLLVYQTSPEGLLMSREYAYRLCVLKELDYVDKNNMTGLKGKVACEINHQELLITELMLENKFDGLSCAEIAALLSPLTCKVAVAGKPANNNNHRVAPKVEPNVKVVPADDDFTVDDISEMTSFSESNGVSENDQSKTNGKRKKKNSREEVERAPQGIIERLKNDLLDIAMRIDQVQQNHNVHTFVTSELNYGLMEVVYQWASGMPFADIMKLTDAQEGIIVRCIQRLDEVLKDVRKAARIIGNPDLYEQMEMTSAAIKRDIVFAASLYTVEE